MSNGSTHARVLHWFVRGGTVRAADGRAAAIDVDPIVVGRDPNTQVKLDDPEVSSLHCELRATNEGILVKDLGSTNGTFIGAVRVHEVVVTTTCELTVGGSSIVIEPTAKHRVD